MAEHVPEQFLDIETVARPDLRLVPPLEPTAEAPRTEGEISYERTSVGDVLVNVVVIVDEQPYELCVNISRHTLGNGQPVTTFFDRFENRHYNADGTVSGDFGRADHLADHALQLAGAR